MLILIIILAIAFPPVGIPALIVYFLTRKNVNVHPSQNSSWYLQLALSKEDALSQWFLLLSMFFLGVTMLSIDRLLGDPIDWRTIVILTTVLGFVTTYYFRALATLIFSLIGMVSWWGLQASQWTRGHELKSSAILVGTMFSLIILRCWTFSRKRLKREAFLFGIPDVWHLVGNRSIVCVIYKTWLRNFVRLNSWWLTFEFLGSYFINDHLTGVLTRNDFLRI